MKQKIVEVIKGTRTFKYIRDNFYSVKIEDFNQTVMEQEETDLCFQQLLTGYAPVMVSRIGSVELRILEKYYKKKKYSEKEYRTAINNAGIFPPTKEILDRVAKTYFEDIAKIDLLGVWSNPFEDVIANEICPDAQLTLLRTMEPFFTDKPWSQYLADKKVLVVNPFSSTISSQYLKREQLFADKNVLPHFELITYTSVQSVGGNVNFSSWFDALEKMKGDIAEIDFDIAIIGAGAYGLPLAAFIKDMGRKAVHLGGATQMLFGVYGKRWEQRDKYSDIINSYWVKPSREETPEAAKNVENACYW